MSRSHPEHRRDEQADTEGMEYVPGTCSACGRLCKVVGQDYGPERNFADVSDCCEAPLAEVYP